MNNKRKVPAKHSAAGMGEGTQALLHQMERKLCNVAYNHMSGNAWYHTASSRIKNKEDSICIVGRDQVILQSMVKAVEQLQKRWCSKATLLVRPIRFVKLQETNYDGDFAGAKSVMLCCSGDLTQDLPLMCQVLRQCLKQGATFCCAIINDLKTANVRSISTYTQQYPELKWLVKCRRLLVISERPEGLHIDCKSEDILIEWLADTHFDNWFKPDKVLDVHDVVKIVHREAQSYLPETETFVRLTIMSILGTISVIITLLLLCFAAKDAGMDRQVVKGRQALQELLEGRRTGKSEWSRSYDSIALLGLQLHDPSWCFHSIANQRTVDRVEIGMLGVLSRSRSLSSRELTVSRLAHDINALLVTYQNPRDFHGHDLVSLLETYLLQRAPFGEHSAFSMSMALIALCNAGVQNELRHIDTLLSRQRPDGSYLNGPDEVAVAAMAMSCSQDIPEVKVSMNRATAYLRQLRRNDGSYGSVYTTSLVLQAFNASNILLRDLEYESTIMWLLRQLKHKLVQDNADIAAQVLIALAGKSMVDIHEATGFWNNLLIKQLDPNSLKNKVRKSGKMPVVNLIPEENKVEIMAVQDETMDVGMKETTKKEENQMEEIKVKSNETQTPPSEPLQNGPKLDMEIVNEVPDVNPDPPKEGTETDSAHIKHHKSNKPGKEKKESKKEKSTFGSMFSWGDDDDDDDDDDDADDDDDDIPSSKHGHYKKK